MNWKHGCDVNPRWRGGSALTDCKFASGWETQFCRDFTSLNDYLEFSDCGQLECSRIRAKFSGAIFIPIGVWLWTNSY